MELGGGNTGQHKPHLVRPRTSKILECLEYEILHEVMRELKGWVKLLPKVVSSRTRTGISASQEPFLEEAALL